MEFCIILYTNEDNIVEYPSISTFLMKIELFLGKKIELLDRSIL